MLGWNYAILLPNGDIKIGWSLKDPKQRKRAGQTWFGESLKFVAVWRAEQSDGKALRRFQRYRLGRSEVCRGLAVRTVEEYAEQENYVFAKLTQQVFAFATPQMPVRKLA